ncbi:hypothetical protein ONZ45_g16870 [Pleurotus djamor]|nr:hypothetical protein ONZ45_g16870 [Pleurotus djamor]
MFFKPSLTLLVVFGSLVASSPLASHDCAMTSANDHALVSQQGGDQYVAPVTDDTGNPFAGVPAHLGSASTFYRAVFGDELPYLTQNYPVGKSPTRHGTSGGDFTVDGTGGLYVFDLDAEAVVYGRCHSVTPIQEWPYFYVVTFSAEYEPLDQVIHVGQ